MSNQRTLPTDYVNSLLYGLEKEFYMQRAEGTKFRLILVGQDYVGDTFGSCIAKNDLKKTLDNLKAKLPQLGTLQSVDFKVSERNIDEYALQGFLVEAEVKGCIHASVEKKLRADGIPPVMCIYANILCNLLEKTVAGPEQRETEIVAIEPGDDCCKVKVVLTKGLSV